MTTTHDSKATGDVGPSEPAVNGSSASASTNKQDQDIEEVNVKALRTNGNNEKRSKTERQQQRRSRKKLQQQQFAVQQEGGGGGGDGGKYGTATTTTTRLPRPRRTERRANSYDANTRNEFFGAGAGTTGTADASPSAHQRMMGVMPLPPQQQPSGSPAAGPHQQLQAMQYQQQAIQYQRQPRRQRHRRANSDSHPAFFSGMRRVDSDPIRYEPPAADSFASAGAGAGAGGGGRGGGMGMGHYYQQFHSERQINYVRPEGKPLVPVLSQEELRAPLPSQRTRTQSFDVVDHHQQQQATTSYGSIQSPAAGRRGRHRRTNSSGDIPPAPPSEFSPRRELTKTFGGGYSQSSPSPRSVVPLAGPGPGGAGGASPGAPPPPGTPNGGGGIVSPPKRQPLSNGHGHGRVWDGRSSPPGSLGLPGFDYPNDPNVDPEAMMTSPMLPRARQHSSGRSNTPSRKRHMRMKSAQIFMQDIKGVKQPRSCFDRSLVFTILFYLQFGAVLFAGAVYGPSAYRSTPESDAKVTAADGAALWVNYSNVLKIAVACGVFSVTLSGVALIVMTVFFRKVIQICLVASIVLSFAWGTVGIGLNPTSFVPITGIIALAFCIGYAFVVWDRIPFAAANLHAGLTGVRSRLSVAVIAYVFQALALGWSILWTFAFTGVYDYINSCDGGLHDEEGVCEAGRVNPAIYVAFAISYYWTLQVITHVVQVTVSGAIGDWWQCRDGSPQAQTCCPRAVTETFVNSTTFNFGSICLGSLLVGFVQTTRQLAELFRPNRDATVLLGLNECIRPLQDCTYDRLDDMVSYFNQWAFAYIGMYGYGMLDAGKNATSLLQYRGWTNLATDDLITNVLYVVSLMIGGCTGCFGILMEDVEFYELTSINNPQVTAFIIGFLIGLVLSNVLMGVVSSSVNAVIICFAERPLEFQVNHPELCAEMREAWSHVWPGCLQGVATPSERDLLRVSSRPWDTIIP